MFRSSTERLTKKFILQNTSSKMRMLEYIDAVVEELIPKSLKQFLGRVDKVLAPKAC
jgi:hypothetical protein